MIPRLPPLALALLGGASVYGIKYMLDRFEPKAIGPPGSTEHLERVWRYRRDVKRAGGVAAASGLIYAGYWMYQARQHRNTPAVLSGNKNEDASFHQDQYVEREKRYMLERQHLLRMEREKEAAAKQQLSQELTAMEDALNQKNK